MKFSPKPLVLLDEGVDLQTVPGVVALGILAAAHKLYVLIAKFLTAGTEILILCLELIAALIPASVLWYGTVGLG